MKLFDRLKNCLCLTMAFLTYRYGIFMSALNRLKFQNLSDTSMYTYVRPICLQWAEVNTTHPWAILRNFQSAPISANNPSKLNELRICFKKTEQIRRIWDLERIKMARADHWSNLWGEILNEMEFIELDWVILSAWFLCACVHVHIFQPQHAEPQGQKTKQSPINYCWYAGLIPLMWFSCWHILEKQNRKPYGMAWHGMAL